MTPSLFPGHGAVTILCSMLAAASITLAAVHGLAMFRRREPARGFMYLLFALSITGMAGLELAMMRAQTPELVAQLHRWYHVPVWSGFMILIWFAPFYFPHGRAWLLYTAGLARTLSLAVNFAAPVSINFLSIDKLHLVRLFGDMIAVPEGTPNPWMLLSQASFLPVIIYVMDASIRDWRADRRRRSVILGGLFLLIVITGVAHMMLAYWGFIHIPVFASIFYLAVAALMGAELIHHISAASRLAYELEKERATIEAVFHGAPCIITVWSADGQLVRWNKYVEEVSGFDPQELVTRKLSDWIAGEDLDRMREDWKKAIADGFVEGEYACQIKSGEKAPLLMRAVTRTIHGRPHVIISGIDLRERYRMEEELRQLHTNLYHLNRVSMAGMLAAGINHEVNQPLTSILLNAECVKRLLDQPAPDLAKIRKYSEDIATQTVRAGQIIKGLRHMIGSKVADYAPVDLQPLLLEANQLVLKLARQKNIHLATALGQPGAMVRGDAVQLRQVFLNVLMNAIDAVDMVEEHRRHLTFSLDAPAGRGDMIVVTISDSGMGLSGEHLARIFEPFFTSKPDRVGVGLAIARMIVEAHGGRIRAENRADYGCSFLIELPRLNG